MNSHRVEAKLNCPFMYISHGLLAFHVLLTIDIRGF